MSILVLMGSGETAPTMVKTHRRVFEKVRPASAVLLDTPYGFQENADDITARARRYFSDSAGQDTTPAGWPRPGDDLARGKALAAVRDADWVFAGPGSPTYALRVWRDTGFGDEIAGVCERGGAVVFASAAALTLGSHTVPVYEVYKCGEAPQWHVGLNVLARLTGIEAAVVPHFNNTEGGHHDTRFCYLGERRLRQLEADLPTQVGILGVDEHTALVMDLADGRVRVEGNGTVTVRRRGATTVFDTGTEIPLAELHALLRGELGPGAAGGGADPAMRAVENTEIQAGVRPSGGDPPTARPATSLRVEADRHDAAFTAALEGADVDGCIRSILALEQAIDDWSGDTLQSDEAGHARRTLRAMIIRLGELAARGADDPREAVRPYLDLLLDLRTTARRDGDYAASDLIRERLARLGVEVRDTPTGAQLEWR